MTTNCLDLLSDRACTAPLRALEGHMLEKMGDTVDPRRLVSRTHIDPDAERDRVDSVDPITGDTQPIRKCRKMNRHVKAPTRRA
jgi:hypothetical protein